LESQKCNDRTTIYNGYAHEPSLEANGARVEIDFRVTLNDRSYQLVEAKGMGFPG